jgi:hypothetical protein
MHQQNIIFESSPAYLIVCAIVAIGLAFLLYKGKHPWSKLWNRILFAVRMMLAFILTFLLLGPIVRQVQNVFEKPHFVILYDNSVSVKEAVDSTNLQALHSQVNDLATGLTENGYEVSLTGLNGDVTSLPEYNAEQSDLTGALKRIASRHEGSSIAGVVLVSDGIYNAGISPRYTPLNFPVYTVGIGDTTQHVDVAIKNIAYNKIAYQGNKFPLKVEVMVTNLVSTPVTATLFQGGKQIDKQVKTSRESQLLIFDFQPLASEQGIQKLDVQLAVNAEEHNTQNNRSSVFVEVVEGKKKILVVAAAPHPDVKALREVIEKNSNYEFVLYTPALNNNAPPTFKPNDIDLAIFHQSPDLRGRTNALFEQYASSKASLFVILGAQSDLRQISKFDLPLKVEGSPREYDEVTPVANTAFSSFMISPEAISILTDFPPVSVHFGKIGISLGAVPLLFQRVGSLATDKPLLAVTQQNERKVAVMLGEGLWRWRLNEFDRTENTAAFDEIFGKLIQYLSTTEDRRRFRSYPIQQEFSDTQPVVFESQVYNAIFEPVYGNNIALELTSEQGKKTSYSYTTSPGNTRYQIGGLQEGVYRYIASTSLDGKTENVRGEFAVIKRQAELLNLTADFDMLQALAANTGGSFYHASNIQSLKNDLQQVQAKTVIHSEERYDTLINLKWVFVVLIIMVSFEWTLRKYFGSY